jgi:large subunit ribosomal protein L25
MDRTAIGHKVRHLRAEGVVPAVLYGGDHPSQNLQVDERSLDRLLTHGGSSHLIQLVGDDFPRTRALIREVQRHPVRRNVMHVDFVRVATGTKIRISVPITVIGTAPATGEGAIMLQTVDSVEIECLPDNLPEHISVDVSGMESIHQRIAFSDLALPDGVTLVGHQPDDALITLTIPRAALPTEEEEVEEEGLLFEPEAIEEQEAEEEEE